MNNETENKQTGAVPVECVALLGALAELAESAYAVCEPIFTASDGGAMWCAMREKSGAKEKVERLKAAIKKAREVAPNAEDEKHD